MNAACVEWLELAPDERVLEIGFGHGRTLAWLAERSPQGRVTGIDPSDTMQRQASDRNWRAIAAGRMRLERGEATKLPFDDASFDQARKKGDVPFPSLVNK
jgi:ubiquinone/menaquinone biosynthesis C-methylase UbiE